MTPNHDRKDEELDRMLAELVGYKFLTFKGRHIITNPDGKKLTCGDNTLTIEQFAALILPRYTQSLDECARVEAGLTDEQHREFRIHLWFVIRETKEAKLDQERAFVSAKPRQRTIALISTLQAKP